jgi:hypothetical protein
VGQLFSTGNAFGSTIAVSAIVGFTCAVRASFDANACVLHMMVTLTFYAPDWDPDVLADID